MKVTQIICDYTEVAGRGQNHPAAFDMKVEVGEEKKDHEVCDIHTKYFVGLYLGEELRSIKITPIDGAAISNSKASHRRTQPKKDECECGYKSPTPQGLAAHMRHCETHQAAIEAA